MQHEPKYTFDEGFLRAALKRDLAHRGVHATLLLITLMGVLWIWHGSMTVLPTAILGAGVVGLWLRLWRGSARRIFDLWRKQSPDRTTLASAQLLKRV